MGIALVDGWMGGEWVVDEKSIGGWVGGWWMGGG